MKCKLGEYVYKDIEKNPYLIELYECLLKKYASKIFNITDGIEDINIVDLLRFADLLSKSTDDKNKEFHKNISQNIVVLLANIYSEDENIKKVLYSVLCNINNYRGIKEDEYYYSDIREFVSKYIEKNLYKISKSEEYFVCDQKEIFDNLNFHKCYSYSGPTSIGKTFIIKKVILNQILSGGQNNYVIVVPTKALISEVTSDLINELGENLIKCKYRVINSHNDIIVEDDLKYIMVYTQERFLMHLTNLNFKIDYVFIDEAHKILYKDRRSMYFYKIIDILNSYSYIPHIIFSAPLIENPEEFLKLLPNTIETAFKVYKFSPVYQQKYIIDYHEGYVKIYNELTRKFIELNYSNINRFDIIDILKKLGKNSKNIVYCESKNEAIKWAKGYSDVLKKLEENDKIQDVQKYIASEIHKDYYLIDMLSRGVAYHVGYVPASIRKQIENLYKDKYINTIFCTSTLLEGVNLPADNLFIPVKDNSRILKRDIDFKNLIGRVGRIKYNLIGNVYIISKNNDNVLEKCSNIIEQDVLREKMSIDEFLTNSRKKEIINALKDGNTVLNKRSSFDELDFSRFIMNSLIYDIKSEYKSNIYLKFKEFLSQEDEERIREKFNLFEVPQDMPITTDQIKKIDQNIIEGFEYPQEVNYENILRFLQKIYISYNWNLYESKNDIGNKNRLKYYALILNQWMNGLRIKQIINNAIENIEQSGKIYMERQIVGYNGSNEQINYIINETLDIIENVILFKIANYFLKFSERCKEKKEIEKLDNDWYEYIQYGTKNNVVIELQRYGFSREVALKINHNKKYIINENGKIYIDKDILNEQDALIASEAHEVFLNNNSVFKI